MARNKSIQEKMEEQQKVLEAAQMKYNELKKKFEQEEEEKKQKKIDSILKDFRAALASSPMLDYNKTSDEYKAVLRTVKTGITTPQPPVKPLRHSKRSTSRVEKKNTNK